MTGASGSGNGSLELLNDHVAEERFDHPTQLDQAVITMLGHLPRLTMPDEILQRLTWGEAAAVAPSPVALPQEQPQDELTARRSRRGLVVGIAAAAALLIAAGAVTLRGTSTPTTTTSVGPVVATGAAYSSATLATDVPALLATTGTDGNPSTQRLVPVPPSTLKGTFAATGEGISSCVSGISTESAVDVVTIDLATFEGQPAAVVVTRPQGAAQLEATVVSPTCTADSPQVLAHVTGPTP